MSAAVLIVACWAVFACMDVAWSRRDARILALSRAVRLSRATRGGR